MKLQYILFSTLLSFGVHALAFEPHKKDSINFIKEVVVSATRTSRDISNLPLPVKVISQSEIQKSNSSKLSDILSQQTGLLVVPNYGYGNNEGVQMQGLDSQYIMIMIDGMPLIGRSSGTLDLERVNIGNVKHVEIIKGASSGLYGSEALGGVINIITQTPRTGINGSADYKYATYNTTDVNLNLNIKKNRIEDTFYLNRYGSDGFNLSSTDKIKTVEPYHSYTVSNNLMYRLSNNSKLTSNFRYYYQKQNQGYNMTDSTQLYGHNFLREMESQLNWNMKWTKNLVSETSVYYTTYHTTSFELNDSNGYFQGFFKQMMLRPEMRFIYNPAKDQQISAGFGYDYETLNRSDFATKAYYRSQFAYLQIESKPVNGIDILAGLRYDHHNIYGHQWSPKLGVHYKLSNHLSLLSSIGYGFKAPDFRQLYLDFTNAGVGYTVLGSYVAATQLAKMQNSGQIQQLVTGINGDYALKPEHSININVGAQWNPASNIHIEANAFYNHLKDMIDTRTIAYKTNGQSVYSYYNIDKVHTQGIEANATWNITSCLQVTAGYQLLYAINDSAANEFKHQLVYAREGNTIIKLKRSDYFGLAERSRHTANFKVYIIFPNGIRN